MTEGIGFGFSVVDVRFPSRPCAATSGHGNLTAITNLQCD